MRELRMQGGKNEHRGDKEAYVEGWKSYDSKESLFDGQKRFNLTNPTAEAKTSFECGFTDAAKTQV